MNARSRLLVSVLCALLGFGLALQVRSNDEATGLGSARQEDLVRILDDLSARSDRLRGEIATLQAARERITAGGGGSAAALGEARRRAATLGILAGTLPATGTGVTVTVADPRGGVRADVLLDAVEELRDAGAEAMQLGPVRVVAATYLLDVPGGVGVSGTTLRPPYRFVVIGDPSTLRAALQIPGGVVDTVGSVRGASARISAGGQVRVTALRPLERPRYARPAPG